MSTRAHLFCLALGCVLPDLLACVVDVIKGAM
jgi:hypothetical protein